MKHAIIPVPIAFGGCEVNIPQPGHIRLVAFHLTKKLVMSGKGDPGFDESPALFCEVIPDAPVRRRRFVAIKMGEAIEHDNAKWVGSAISAGTGSVVSVFELGESPS